MSALASVAAVLFLLAVVCGLAPARRPGRPWGAQWLLVGLGLLLAASVAVPVNLTDDGHHLSRPSAATCGKVCHGTVPRPGTP